MVRNFCAVFAQAESTNTVFKTLGEEQKVCDSILSIACDLFAAQAVRKDGRLACLRETLQLFHTSKYVSTSTHKARRSAT